MKQKLSSLDQQTILTSDLIKPDRVRNLYAAIKRGGIVGGAGLSYVAAGLSSSGPTVSMQHFNRILDFNEAEGWIKVEAGCSLGKLFSFLTPRGLQLFVQPGYPAITVGGCVAGNVHGKNHSREGVFGRHVVSLTLYHPDKGTIICSPSENKDVFDLTVGGFGLTGVILDVTIKLKSLVSQVMDVRHTPVDNLSDGFRKIQALKDNADMVMAWLDLSRPRADTIGQGFIVSAKYIEGADIDSRSEWQSRLNTSKRFKFNLFNRWTMPVINELYRSKNLQMDAHRVVSFQDILFPAYGKESYFYGYGLSGFVEQQTLVPLDRMDDYISAFTSLFKKYDVPVALTTLKLFGGGQDKFLNYDGEGMSFTIDVASTSASLKFLGELDYLNCEFDAKTAILKDGRLPADIVKRQYKEYDLFRQQLHKFDAGRFFQSELSKRLEL